MEYKSISSPVLSADIAFSNYYYDYCVDFNLILRLELESMID
jgi:hypothetical protein